ncbi:hypothetical protein OV090_21215 [Nannocystis sp. RBIL2]|uniref:hypothetical protein n=1 Tax=Nannocystis sp. RBIL2 TaxID=2996788 RepID=UPI00226D86E7|nr:hypothetical protein [Nannocystis sp. RBIL2]MCY1067284.1 hypothetical protein [Nannocystis sp. RBIL2]
MITKRTGNRARSLCSDVSLAFVLSSSIFACQNEGEDCVTFGPRAEALVPEDAVFCGASSIPDDIKHKDNIAACLTKHLQDCTPAWGRFLVPHQNDIYLAIYYVIVNDSCEATVLVALDPEAPDDAFTEVTCKKLEATGDGGSVSTSECGAKIAYPRCDTSS